MDEMPKLTTKEQILSITIAAVISTIVSLITVFSMDYFHIRIF
jgi:hypothetical protein